MIESDILPFAASFRDAFSVAIVLSKTFWFLRIGLCNVESKGGAFRADVFTESS